MGWARTSQGSLIVHDKNAALGYREVRDSERHDDESKGRKHVRRRPEDWEMFTPKVSYEPIVPYETWENNNERLLERGNALGLGVKKANVESNYALQVLCGDCSEKMIGTSGKYVCSNYYKKDIDGQRVCSHNTIDADMLHSFVIASVRDKVKKGKTQRQLKKAIQAIFQQRVDSSSQSTEPRNTAGRDKRIRQIIALAKEVEEDLYGENSVETTELRHKLKRRLRELDVELTDLKATVDVIPKETTNADIGSKTQEALAILDDLDVFINRLGKRELTALFTAIGAEVTVSFEHIKQKSRTISKPVGGKLKLGRGVGFNLQVQAEEDDGTNKLKTATKSRPTKKAASRRRDHSLGKGGRGDRI